MPIIVKRDCEGCGGCGFITDTRREGDKVVIRQWTCACRKVQLTPDEIEKLRAYFAANPIQA